MPELPEVETVCRGLREKLRGRRIAQVVVRHPSIIHQDMTPEDFEQRLQGRFIQDIERRGKYIVSVLDEGWLVCHLRMSGKLLAMDKNATLGKHDHLLVVLDDGSKLFYNDVRRFGGFYYSLENPNSSPPLSLLGAEPLEEDFNEAYLHKATRRRKKPVKSLLLDQHVVAGIGNIYADEILFAAGIRPRKRAERLTHKECASIVVQTKRILREAIQAGGSTIRDYVSSAGEEGGFQFSHQVYGRGGKACKKCGATLNQVEVGGRSSVYCPHCQKS